jgi:hypothetical protein
MGPKATEADKSHLYVNVAICRIIRHIAFHMLSLEIARHRQAF